MSAELLPPQGNRFPVELPPGRWVVNMRDDGTYQATRVQNEKGEPPSAVALPDVNAMFARRRETAARLRDRLNERLADDDF